MTQYAIRYGDEVVQDPSFRCIADVVFTFHAAYTDQQRRVTGVLVSRETEDSEWKEVVTTDWSNERADVLARFAEELAKATGDGSKKRQAGTKPPWYEDDSHEAAVFSHLTKWKRGELIDPDSGAHPLVHLAWRALAIALQETGNIPDV